MRIDGPMSSRKDDDITTNLVAPSPHCRPLVPFNAILLGHMLCTGVPVLWRHSGDRWRCQLCVSPMFLGAVTFLFLVTSRQPMPQSIMTKLVNSSYAPHDANAIGVF